MTNLRWKAARTGDPVIDRAFQDLADKLAGHADAIESITAPIVEIVTGDFTVTDQDYIDFRGSRAASIKLAVAAREGAGRGSEIRVQNNGVTAINVTAQGRETINGLALISVAVGSLLIAVSNGADKWQAIVTTAPVARAGHIIQDNGADKAQRSHLNFVGATVADDPGNDATKVTIASGLPGHVIQDNGSDQTQRAKLDFIGFTVADDAGNNRTKVTAPAASLAGHVIQDNGVDQTQRAKLDFIDTIVTDDAGGNRTKVQVFRPDYQGIYLATSWYPAGQYAVTQTTGVGLGATSHDGFIFAFPHYFGRACTINKFGMFHAGGTGSGGCKSWIAWYSANAAGDGPDVRLADAEQVSTGFHSHTDTTISLSVAAGTILWACIQVNANEAGNGHPTIPVKDMFHCLGTEYPADGVSSSPSTLWRLGYRVTFTYGRPPATWGATGATKLLGSASAIPTFFFTATPV